MLLDLLYIAVGIVTSPYWLIRLIATGKIRTDWRARFGFAQPMPDSHVSRILIHAVSVGEVNAVEKMVAALGDEFEIVVAATTNTGFTRARSLYSEKHTVVRYPLDFSWSVRRFLRAVNPSAVSLVELEVWPNFTRACELRGVPVCVVNGRLSARSAKRYRVVRWLIRPAFSRLTFAGVQDAEYAKRFIELGTPAKRVHITDTMKWDTAVIADTVPGADRLAAELGIDRTRPLVVAGSTAPREHGLLHGAVPDHVQLLCAPRKPEWYDAAARDLPGCVRRTAGQPRPGATRFLLDTMGELRMAYSLADIVVVGRTFESLGGSDMMEPVALGKPTIIGPHVENFAEMARVLEESDGIIPVHEETLAETILALLADETRRAAFGERGRRVVQQRQGASARHAEMIRKLVVPAHS